MAFSAVSSGEKTCSKSGKYHQNNLHPILVPGIIFLTLSNFFFIPNWQTPAQSQQNKIYNVIFSTLNRFSLTGLDIGARRKLIYLSSINFRVPLVFLAGATPRIFARKNKRVREVVKRLIQRRV